MNEVFSQKAYILIYTKKLTEEQPPDNIQKNKKKRKRSSTEGEQYMTLSGSIDRDNTTKAKIIGFCKNIKPYTAGTYSSDCIDT